MEAENNSSNTITCTANDDNKELEVDHVQLPGFRFHPTDEELVGFYLKRKVEKRPITIELIKQADIYKYDPWDLPKSGNVGDKEWYFFCKRGRKYRNSIRPNRVTGSGFWKATGIDKPIYSSGGHDCIGLKKSLVFYRGCAGKGNKTDWMMHEFRLPLAGHDKSTNRINITTNSINDQEAEVWTLCRILKRNFSYRKYIPGWPPLAAKRAVTINPISDATCTIDSSHHYNICFNAPTITTSHADQSFANQQFPSQYSFSSPEFITSQQASPAANSSFSSSICGDINELLRQTVDWEDLRSIVDCATARTTADPF